MNRNNDDDTDKPDQPGRSSRHDNGMPAESREANIARREHDVINHEADILSREKRVAAREEALDLREHKADSREEKADSREVKANSREEKADSLEWDINTAETTQAASDDHINLLQQANEHLVIATIEAQKLAEQLLTTQAQLEIAKVTAEKANLAKSDFLSSMSHELRYPTQCHPRLSPSYWRQVSRRRSATARN